MGQLALTAISGAASFVSSMQAGNTAAAEAKFQQKQYESASRDEILKATQEEVIRRRELNDTLSTINAVRAGRGLSLNSPTGKTIVKNTISEANKDIQIAKTNRLIMADANRQSGKFAGSRAQYERSSGTMKGFTSLLDSGYTISKMYKPMKVY